MTLHSKREGIEKPQERESTWFAEDAILWSSALRKLGVSAGVSTRADGSMAGSHHPLAEQAENRAALARRLGFEAVVRAKQVHGRDVAYVTAAVEPWPIADALWTDRPGVLLGIAAADCVPVLVADPRTPRSFGPRACGRSRSRASARCPAERICGRIAVAVLTGSTAHNSGSSAGRGSRQRCRDRHLRYRDHEGRAARQARHDRR